MHAPARSEDIRAEVAELLGVGADAVDPGSNLIGQGLDSIRMMTLAGRWRRQGIAVDFATLAATPTVEAWSLSWSLPARQSADQQSRRRGGAATGDAPGEPFPLAPMQHAMWVGRHDNQPLGGVAGHLYVEFDGGPIDPERLRAAATAAGAAPSDAAGAVSARRHPAHRSGQRMRRLSGHRRRTFAGLDADVVDQRLAAIRDAKSHQQLDGAGVRATL